MIKIIGIGNEFRGDDYIGLAVARKIKKILKGKIEVKEISDPSRLLHLIEKEDEVIIVDSARSGVESGTVLRFEIIPRELPESVFSTHTIPLQKILELLKLLDKIPKKMIIYAVEGECFDEGKKLSEKVKTAIDKVCMFILNDLKNFSSSSFHFLLKCLL